MSRKRASASVVLVHGGFLGPWSWSDVATILSDRGIATAVPELPSMSHDLGDLYADAAKVREVLDQHAPPVLVCGHSYGGAVVTEAAAGPHPAVAHLLYLAAAVPDINESMADLAKTGANPSDSARSEGPVPGPTGSIELPPEQADVALFHDCSAERARQATALLQPMNPAVGTQPLTGAAWRDVPSTFVRCSQDRMPELVTAAFLDRGPELITLPTGHCPNWSRPELVADLIAKRAKKLAAA